jgi:hypothetical protein
MRTPAQSEAKDLMNAIDGLGYYFNNSNIFLKLYFFIQKLFIFIGTNEAALIGKFSV